MRQEGLTEKEISDGLGYKSTKDYRNAKSIAINEKRQGQINQAQKLKDTGMSTSAIGREMGINESTVRSLLEPGAKDKVQVLESTKSMLKDSIDKKEYIDIGSGVENHLGISNTKLDTAVAALQQEGYKKYWVRVPQVTQPGQLTTVTVLGKPGSSYPKLEQINQIQNFSNDGGRSYLGIHDPISISSKRVAINYAEDGGDKADGVIYVRPGVKDISLGGNHYAQVRVMVDKSHYLKGMA